MSNPVKPQKSLLSKLLPASMLPSMLVSVVVMLLVFSLIMVTSASIPFAQAKGWSELYFFYRQLAYIGVGCVLALVLYHIPLRWLFRLEFIVIALVVCVCLLIITLSGDKINGSRRWLEFGGINFQPVEGLKVLIIMFTADFVIRRFDELRQSWTAFLRMGVMMFCIIFVLALQPDFGSAVIVGCTVAVMMFVAGLRLRELAVLFGLGLMAVISAVRLEPYRMTRVTSFGNPFDDLKDSDFQQGGSIIAFARGELTGEGYGGSLLKLVGLPEAHTDFLLAVTGEELGFLGVSFLILLQIILILIMFRTSYVMLERRQFRLGYYAFGLAILFFGQIFINAGMTTGLIPPKGLTMPLFSFGGSSMVSCLMAIGILLRILKESPTIEPQHCRYY